MQQAEISQQDLSKPQKETEVTVQLSEAITENDSDTVSNVSPTFRQATHPAGHFIQFNPDQHEYLHAGEPLVSVTTLIKQWFKPFDAEAVAKKKANREGGSFEALMAEWERKRDEAATFGTKIHSMADLILQEKRNEAADHLASDERDRAYLAAVKEALRRIALGYDVIESEKIVFSPEFKVAGTIDLLLRSRATGEIVVADWKTNRELKFEGYASAKGIGLCSHLSDCNFTHYSLQISAYSKLLVREGYLPPGTKVRGILLHLAEKQGSPAICDYVKTKDLGAEIEEIFSAHFAVRNSTLAKI